MCEARTEFIAPASDRFVADHNPALEQQLFDITQAELKPEIPAHRATDDSRRKAMTVVKRFCILHHAILLDHLSNVTTPSSGPIDCSWLLETWSAGNKKSPDRASHTVAVATVASTYASAASQALSTGAVPPSSADVAAGQKHVLSTADARVRAFGTAAFGGRARQGSAVIDS